MKNWSILIAIAFLPLVSYSQQRWDTIPFGPDHYRARYELFKKEPVVKEKIIFLGNSITEGGNWKKLLKDSSVINRGVSGDITFGVLNRLDEVIKRKPSKLFLLIGINDLAKGIPDEVVMQNIFTIVYRLRTGSPKTQIYVQSILPTNSTIPNPPLPEHINKGEHILVVNSQLKKYSEKLKFTYVDLYPKFLNAEGQLDTQYSGDGLHLNDAGYKQWVSVLKSLKLL